MKTNFAAKKKPETPAIPSIPGQDRAQARFSASGTPEHSASRFRPGLLASFSALLLVPSLFSVLFFRPQPYAIAETTGWSDTMETVYGEEGFLRGLYTEVTQLQPVVVQDNVIVTYSITKTDLADVAFSLSAEAEFDEYGEYDYVNSSDFGFEADQVYVSAVLSKDGVSDRQALDTPIVTTYEEYYVMTEADYDYLTTDGEDFLEAYRKFSPEKYSTITLDNDGVASQNGIVTFTVSNPDTNYLSGAVNIVYKKDGRVVFGDIYSFYSSSSTSSKTYAYTPECELPAYDEVELINLYS